MTGYSESFARGRNPRFLQGKDTCSETKERIRLQLKEGKSFKESVINYRKNGSSYRCELEIFPLKNPLGDIKAYLAVEKEVKHQNEPIY